MVKFMWLSYFKLKWLLPITFCLILIFVSIFSFSKVSTVSVSGSPIIWSENYIEENEISNNGEKKKYIKWFEFNVSYEVLDKTSKLDINSHVKNENVKLNWIELISYLACKYGNNFSKFKSKDLDSLVEKLRTGQTMNDITKDMKNYSYYFEGYDSVLHEFIGTYQVEVKNSSLNNSQTEQTTNVSTPDNSTSQQIENRQFEEKYGIKAFHPIAKNYSYSHYDDFGASRSYGYKRLHFGNDLMGSIGSPVIAVESGIVEAVRLESIWWLENWYS